MASIQELTAALKDHLESKGVLDKVRSSLRAEIYNTINDKSLQIHKPTNENYLLNELIREYLEYNNYNYTNSTFETESGNDKAPLDRNFLSRQLGVSESEDTRAVPLLYALVFGQKEVRRERSPDVQGEVRSKGKKGGK
jgi:lisH domain-containing protein FOPNL